MEERERSSIESLGDLQPELRSATGRSEGVQPDKLPFKSTGSEHLDIAKFRATSRPTLIVTPYEALELIKNDYSEKEPRLQLGAVPLVDLFENQELASLRPQDYQKQKDLTFKNFLQNQTVRSLSVIIPVARGRKKAFLDCLESIGRQTFLEFHPEKVELLVIQDGDSTEDEGSPISRELFCQVSQFPKKARRLVYVYLLTPGLEANEGRSTARNVGVSYARHEIAFFIDSSMVLDKNFLAEHMIRHQRIPQIALLGFKENISAEDFDKQRPAIQQGLVRPDYRKDWKWNHVLKNHEAGFLYRNRYYTAGDEIHYMEISTNLKTLKGTDCIGQRMLPTFFHTGITSVPLDAVKQVGGFEQGFNPLWGFEDSFLGALLLVKDIKLVPCPSSVAFKIEHLEDEGKDVDRELNRAQFDERLKKTSLSDFGQEALRKKINSLKSRRILNRVTFKENKVRVMTLS